MQNGGTEDAPRGGGPSLKIKLSWWIWVLVKYPALVLHYSEEGAGCCVFLHKSPQYGYSV
jgi:hypothetical protein